MLLHFKHLGEGEPLVLLHGLFGKADNWLGVAPRLAEQFHVFIPDLRNHGLSPHHAEMDYSSMAADVDQFLDAQGIVSTALVGHSMGGKVAMRFALEYPHRVTKLVVVDMAPRAYARRYDHIIEALLGLKLSSFAGRQQIEEALAPAIPSLNLRRFLLKSLGRDSHGRFVWKMNLRGLADNYFRLEKELVSDSFFSGPTLFIRGGQSDYLTAADEPGIRSLFPQVQFQSVSMANHWVHADAPDEFVSLLLDFL